MNSINFNISGYPVNLTFHDDGHDGPAFIVSAMKSKSVFVSFARFKRFEDADAHCRKYSTYYPFVKFFIHRSLF